MYPYTQYLILLLAAVTLIAILIRTLRITKAVRTEQLIAGDAAGCSLSIGLAGCSVLCHGVSNMEYISELLSSEYERYEVIILLDADRYPDLFNEIIHHYKLVRVNNPDSTDFRHTAIRRLYRSYHRCFRRLVVVDKGLTDAFDDFNAAATVASFDYLLPIDGSRHLRPGAIESLSIAIANNHHTATDLIYSRADDAALFRRNAVAGQGGFSARIVSRIPRSHRLTIYYPLFQTIHPITAGQLALRIILPAALIIAAAILFGTLAAAILLSTVVATIAAIRFTLHLIDGKCSIQAILCQIIHTRIFFYPRNFFLS